MLRLTTLRRWMRETADVWRGVLLSLLLAIAPRAQAHRPSDGWLQLTVTNRSITLQLDLALKDLDGVLGLNTSDNATMSWSELRRREPDLDEYITRHLTLTNAVERLVLVPEPLRLVNHEDVVCVSLLFTAEAAVPLTRLTLTYRCLFDLDPQHRALVTAQWSGAQVAEIAAPGTDQLLSAESFTGLFSPGSPSVTFMGPVPGLKAPRGASPGLVPFFFEGVHHIWSGYDHLLFLAALLLPAVLWRSVDGWQPINTFGRAVTIVLQVITAFTLAHSLTLALAALGLARPPSRVVESAIAASVLYAAARNLWGRGRTATVVSHHAWTKVIAVPFGFGLIHGFGFANALGELGLSGAAMAVPLVGFNLGVEAGQLVAVAAFLPVAFALRKTTFYRRGILPFGSLVIALTAIAWLVDRAWAIGFMPF